MICLPEKSISADNAHTGGGNHANCFFSMETKSLGLILDSFHSPTFKSFFFSAPLTDPPYSVSLFLSLPLSIVDGVVRINAPEPKKLIQL